jgi:hypothetical protein
MSAYKMKEFELNSLSIIFNICGATGLVTNTMGCFAGSLGNVVGVCMDLAKEQAKSHHPIDLRLSRAQIFRMGGPLLGLPNNDYVNLAVACTMVGLSAAGLTAAVAAGTPAAIFFGAMCLFGDAIAYGAAQAGFEVDHDQHSEAVRIGQQRRILMYLEMAYNKEQGRRPGMRHPVAR